MKNGDEMALEKEQLQERIDYLYEILLQLKTVEDCRALFLDLCTFKEVEQMAQRAYAAKLFLQGKTYNQIIAETELSSTTLSRISRSLSYGSGGYSKFIKPDGKKGE